VEYENYNIYKKISAFITPTEKKNEKIIEYYIFMTEPISITKSFLALGVIKLLSSMKLPYYFIL
jgi:hypothetical protein